MFLSSHLNNSRAVPPNVDVVFVNWYKSLSILFSSTVMVFTTLMCRVTGRRRMGPTGSDMCMWNC